MEKSLKNKMQNVMMKMMASCEDASFLIDKSAYTKLSCSEKMSMKLHLLSCKFCRAYQKDSLIITKNIPNILDINKTDLRLSDEQKTRLKDSLK